jgi:hypothetical protein
MVITVRRGIVIIRCTENGSLNYFAALLRRDGIIGGLAHDFEYIFTTDSHAAIATIANCVSRWICGVIAAS